MLRSRSNREEGTGRIVREIAGEDELLLPAGPPVKERHELVVRVRTRRASAVRGDPFAVSLESGDPADVDAGTPARQLRVQSVDPVRSEIVDRVLPPLPLNPVGDSPRLGGVVLAGGRGRAVVEIEPG
ncbi:hypothetical protein C7V51_03180 [Rathayibacter iranicus]|uniref:Uncharacterized protein n=1 Tax=Rathayibacter iranicus TaxID=59737 RepID=A0AAD1AE73_9MICO|nr:hypothetical protein C7V51_03180 [Rathayibacter iranicus]